MITKTLRISGGDYSTLPQITTYLNGLLTSGFTDNITINVEGGAVFGTEGVDYGFIMGGGTFDFGNYSVTFQTDPTEVATPATLKGQLLLNGQTFINTVGSVIKRSQLNLSNNSYMTKFDSSVSASPDFTDIACNIYQTNSGIYIETSTSLGNLRIQKCNLFTNASGYGLVGTNNIASVVATNTLFCNYSASAFAISGAPSASGDYLSGYNYGAGATTFSVAYTNTTVDVDPNLTENIIQSAVDSTDTMRARNAFPTVSSTSLIDAGTATGAPATDIIGTSVPQGSVADIGAYEYLATPYIAPDFRLKEDSPAIRIVETIPVQKADSVELIDYGSIYFNKYQDGSSRLEPYDAGALPLFKGGSALILMLMNNNKGDL